MEWLVYCKSHECIQFSSIMGNQLEAPISCKQCDWASATACLPRTNKDNLKPIAKLLITTTQDSSIVNKPAIHNEASSSIEETCYTDLHTSSSSANPEQLPIHPHASCNLDENIMYVNYAVDDEMQRILKLI